MPAKLEIVIEAANRARQALEQVQRQLRQIAAIQQRSLGRQSVRQANREIVREQQRRFRIEQNLVRSARKLRAEQEQDERRAIRETTKAAERAARDRQRLFRQTAQAARRAAFQIQQSFVRAFTGQGGLFGLSLRLFAPLGGVRRGVGDIARGAGGLLNLFQGGFLRAPINALRAASDLVRGIGGALGGLVAQLGLIQGLLPRTFGALLGLLPRVGGFLSGIGASLGFIAESLASIAGEIVRVFGEALGGVFRVAGEAASGIIGIFEEIVSPITTVFGLIRFAWRFSLVAMAAATTAFISSSISDFTEFSRIVIEAIAQLPVRNAAEVDRLFGEISSAAREISRDVGVSMDDTAGSIRRSLSVGFELGEQFRGTARDARLLAKAASQFSLAGADVGDTTNLLVTILNSFNQQVRNAQQAADIMFATFQEGGGEAQFFARGFGIIASAVAASAGSIEDAAAAAALLSQSTIDQPRIFLELSRAFENIIKNSERLGPALVQNARGGIDFFATLENIRQVIDRFGGPETVRGAAILREIVGDRIQTRRAFARALVALPQRIGEIRTAIRDSAGSLERFVEAIDEQPVRRLDRMSAAFDRMQRSIGALFSPAVVAVARFFERVFDTIDKTINDLVRTGGFDRLSNSLRQFFDALGLPSADTVFETIEQVVRDLATKHLPNAVDQATLLVEKFKELDFREITFGIISTIQGAINAILSGIEQIAPRIITVIERLASFVIDTVERALRDPVLQNILGRLGINIPLAAPGIVAGARRNVIGALTRGGGRAVIQESGFAAVKRAGLIGIFQPRTLRGIISDVTTGVITPGEGLRRIESLQGRVLSDQERAAILGALQAANAATPFGQARAGIRGAAGEARGFFEGGGLGRVDLTGALAEREQQGLAERQAARVTTAVSDVSRGNFSTLLDILQNMLDDSREVQNRLSALEGK